MKKILAGFRSRPSRRSRRVCGQRGFTLIELAIVMAVVGLVLGASLMPLRALDENRQLRAETSRMETVRDAVLGYALRHRTREFEGACRTVSYPDSADLPRTISPGRPYLPCPDVDGDGFEDRVPADKFIQGVETEPMMAVPIQVTVAGGELGFYGECLASRGTIPWRTLGVPPADGWGNRYTYFADPLFSNAVFGFDDQTIADIYDRRLPDDPPRSPVNFDTGIAGPGGEAATDRRCPAVICLGGGVDLDDPPNGVDPDTEPDEANACTEHLNAAATDPLLRCAWRADRIPALILKSGAIAESEISDGKTIPQGGIRDGVPFVIVSHGPNGRGAVNHWATLGAPANPTGDLGPVCNRGQFSSTSSGEADLLPPDNYPDDNHEAMNAARLAPGNESARRCPPLRGLANRADATGTELLPSVFVWEPPGGGYAARKFDDLLSWMTREELSLAMGGGIPESPPPVCAGI